MARALLGLIALGCMITSGCNREHSIIGSWTWQEDVQIGENYFPSAGVDTYSEDGSYRSVGRIQLAERKVLVVSEQGHWKLDKAMLKVTLDNVHWDMEGDASSAEIVKSKLARDKAKIIKSVNDEKQVEVSWVTADAFSFIKYSKKHSFFRKK